MPLAKLHARAVFAARLKAARLTAGFTQQALGIQAGIAEDVASTRVNRYERAVHDADLETAQRLADALGVPLAALYADSDEMAKAIQAFASLTHAEQRAAADELVAKVESSEGRRKPRR